MTCSACGHQNREARRAVSADVSALQRNPQMTQMTQIRCYGWTESNSIGTFIASELTVGSDFRARCRFHAAVCSHLRSSASSVDFRFIVTSRLA